MKLVNLILWFDRSNRKHSLRVAKRQKSLFCRRIGDQCRFIHKPQSMATTEGCLATMKQLKIRNLKTVLSYCNGTYKELNRFYENAIKKIKKTRTRIQSTTAKSPMNRLEEIKEYDDQSLIPISSDSSYTSLRRRQDKLRQYKYQSDSDPKSIPDIRPVQIRLTPMTFTGNKKSEQNMLPMERSMYLTDSDRDTSSGWEQTF